MPEEYDDRLRRHEEQIAELTRLFERQSEARRGRGSARRSEAMQGLVIDPEGYVVIEFESDEAREAFVADWVPRGLVYRSMRYNRDGPPRLTFKLSDFQHPFRLSPRGSLDAD